MCIFLAYHFEFVSSFCCCCCFMSSVCFFSRVRCCFCCSCCLLINASLLAAMTEKVDSRKTLGGECKNWEQLSTAKKSCFRAPKNNYHDPQRHDDYELPGKGQRV